MLIRPSKHIPSIPIRLVDKLLLRHTHHPDKGCVEAEPRAICLYLQLFVEVRGRHGGELEWRVGLDRDGSHFG
jgi:hypothetical protein